MGTDVSSAKEHKGQAIGFDFAGVEALAEQLLKSLTTYEKELGWAEFVSELSKELGRDRVQLEYVKNKLGPAYYAFPKDVKSIPERNEADEKFFLLFTRRMNGLFEDVEKRLKTLEAEKKEIKLSGEDIQQFSLALIFFELELINGFSAYNQQWLSQHQNENRAGVQYLGFLESLRRSLDAPFGIRAPLMHRISRLLNVVSTPVYARNIMTFCMSSLMNLQAQRADLAKAVASEEQPLREVEYMQKEFAGVRERLKQERMKKAMLQLVSLVFGSAKRQGQPADTQLDQLMKLIGEIFQIEANLVKTIVFGGREKALVENQYVLFFLRTLLDTATKLAMHYGEVDANCVNDLVVFLSSLYSADGRKGESTGVTMYNSLLKKIAEIQGSYKIAWLEAIIKEAQQDEEKKKEKKQELSPEEKKKEEKKEEIKHDRKL